jgi:DNA-binding XRE family transcriptional regulator
MEPKRRMTSDALVILHRRFIGNDPKRLASLQEERDKAAVARQIYDMRTKAGLTQRQLAKIVGTTASAISRLEDADYQGHSLTMLRKIAKALNCRIKVELVPMAAA